MSKPRKVQVLIVSDDGEVLDSAPVDLTNEECKLAVRVLHHTKSDHAASVVFTIPEEYFKE